MKLFQDGNRLLQLIRIKFLLGLSKLLLDSPVWIGASRRNHQANRKQRKKAKRSQMNFTIGHRKRLLRTTRSVKRPELIVLTALFLSGFFTAASPALAIQPGAPILEKQMDGFSPESYHEAVEGLLADFEAQRGEKIRPGSQGRVGLKVYTNSGAGLATPLPLVRGLIEALVERGFEPENIFLVDKSLHRLRQSGFLTDLSDGQTRFGKHPVYILETGEFYDEIWYYDSPLPPRREAGVGIRRGQFNYEPDSTDRHSYLAAPLLLDVDFWINLPVYTDHPVLGINGALVNATLWNASNTSRFFHSEASGAGAVAEMAAIPELAEKWLFSLVSLERYQFIGGPVFRSLYTASEPVVLLGADPVALDSRMFRKINDQRARHRFDELEEGLTLLEYAAQLGLGRPEPGATSPLTLRRPSERDSEPTPSE